MGIRVHKVLGYGTKPPKGMIDEEKLSEIVTDFHDMSFSRFKKEFSKKGDVFKVVFRGAEGYVQGDAVTESDLEFAEKILRDERRYGDDPWRLSDCVHYDFESGVSKGIVLVPFLSGREWFRYDDAIDYYEETDVKGEQSSRFDVLKRCGICPYEGFMIRLRMPPKGVYKGKSDPLKTGRRKGLKKGLIEAGTYNLIVGWNGSTKLAKGKVLRHFLDDFRPSFPSSIGMIVAMLSDCIRDPKEFMDSLKPCLYTYWS